MMQFVDSFSCLLSKEKNLFVLHLMQEEPFIGSDDDVNTTSHEVASVIMDSKTAIDLCKAIAEVYQVSSNATNAENENAPS